jgi:hypothetical protein
MSQPRLQAVNGEVWLGESDAPPTPPTIGTNSANAGGANPPNSGNAGKAQKQRADRSLPTDRLSFEKQVEVLRAIAQMSGNARRPVTAEDLSAAIGLKGNTGGLSNKFFRDCGWVESAGRGAYAATEPLLEHHRHLNVDAQDVAGARRYLAASARGSWFWEAIEPMLDDGGARQTMILHSLSKAAGAYEHTPQLLLILTWLDWLGLVRRDGELLFRTASAEGGPTAEPGSSLEDESAHDVLTAAPADLSGTQGSEMADCSGSVDLADRLADRTEASALVSFNFSVRITADDAAKLSAEQLQSLLTFAEKLRG